MRYIKYFESVYSDQEIKDSIKDYLISLSDTGFLINIYVYPKEIECNISKSGIDKFQFKEIKEEIYGLLNFINKSYDISIDRIEIGNDTIGNAGYEIINNFYNIHEYANIWNDNIYDVQLFFKK